MSWALMLHPDGLKCDVFITHAWMEGLYEFVDKVLYSFPRRAKTAWICFLANPQNLNISDLIRSPPDSPFAKALHSSSCMLVVPNEKASIYSRLWCAYEAFLACDTNKVIITAQPAMRWKEKVGELKWMALAAVLGWLLSEAAGSDGVAEGVRTAWFQFSTISEKLLMIWSTVSAVPAQRRVANLLGLALSVSMLGTATIAQGDHQAQSASIGAHGVDGSLSTRAVHEQFGFVMGSSRILLW